MLRVDRAKFVESFAAAAQVAPQRTPKPILQNVKVVATPNECRLFATDMEFSLAIDADGADVFKPGQCLLPAARMLSILREMREEVVDIKVEGNSATVLGGKSKFTFQTQDADLFPVAGEVPEELPLLTLPAAQFRTLLKRTMYAVDPDSPRVTFGGVYFETNGSYLHAVGTDSRRLSHASVAVLEAEAFQGFASSTIVPQHSCQLLDKLIGSEEGNVSIGVVGNDFLVQTTAATIRTRLLEGKFPKWRDIVPQRSAMECVSINREALLAAVRQAAIVATSENRAVDFRIADQTLAVSARSAEHGAGEIEIPCVSAAEDRIETFNFQYMQDFLKATDVETIEWLAKDEGRASLFIGDEGYEYVLMPLAREEVESNRNTAAEPKRRAG